MPGGHVLERGQRRRHTLLSVTAALAASATLTALAACGALLQEPPGVSYAKSVEQLGIYPVYPPREDLQVGDIYGIENSPGVENVRKRSVFVANVDLTGQIRGYLDHRYEFGDTRADAAATVNGVSAYLPSQSDAPGKGYVLDRSNLKDLPIAGFPAIEVDSGLSIGVAGAPQNLAAIFGLEAAKTLKMTLHFGLVTSYSVPLPTAYDALNAYCQPITGKLPRNCDSTWLAFFINEKYQLGSGAGSVKRALPLMVSKVYLARAISYTFNDRTLAAAAASVAGGTGTTAPTAPVVDPSLLASAVGKDSSDMVNALAAFQSALNGTVSGKPNEQGAAASLASINEDSVTFEEIFQRPVVIGYEGAYLDPDELLKNWRATNG